jgi:hypothetical protein
MKHIREIMDILEPHEDEKWATDYESKQKIEKIILIAFKRCQIELADYDEDSIFYDTDDRSATVRLDDTSITTDKIAELMKSGLSNNYKISSTSDGLIIEFVVNPSLDHTI